MSKLFKEALDKISKETHEKVANYLDFIELCVVQKSLRDEGFLLTITNELSDSDSLVYSFELRYENKKGKTILNRLTTYYSYHLNEGYWSTYEEALIKGIEYTLKLKENEVSNKK